MGSYNSTQVDSLAKTQGTRSHKAKIIMSTPVKTYSKLELLKLRPAQTCQKIAQTAEFQRMPEITKSIPTKCQNSDGSETERANVELVEGLRAKEELRMARKHRNFLRRERTRQRKAHAKERQEREKSEKPTVLAVTESIFKSVPSYATVYLSRTETPRTWANSKLRRAK